MRPEDLGIGKLFEKVRDALVVAQAETQRIVLWNRAAELVFGYCSSEALGLRVETLVPDRLKEEHRAGIARYAKSGHGPYIDSSGPLELPALRKGGEEIWVELSLSPIMPEGGAKDGAGRFVLAIIRDINQRKRAEEEIRRLNETLEGEVQERTAELAASKNELRDLLGKLLVAQEEERRRVAYEIHDGLTQVAIAAHQHLQIFAESHPPGSRVNPGELELALSLVQRVVREARHVIEGLRPTALDDFGLAAALRLMAEEVREEGLRVAYEENLGAARLSSEVETGLYRVAQEALSNARKHAGTKEARMQLALGKRKVRLEVEDRGRGFDPRALRRDGGPGERVGLAGMRERIGLLGGTLLITSAPGEGTRLVAEVPKQGTLHKGKGTSQ